MNPPALPASRSRASALIAAAIGIALLSVLGSAAQADRPGAVFIVRHAEKQGDGDAALTPAGESRAEALAERLADRDIQAIIVSDMKRTQQTAAPLKELTRVELTVIPDHAENLGALVARINESRRHGALLVVTHSNVLPLLVCRLTGIAVAVVNDLEFDRIYELDGGFAAAIYGVPFVGERSTERAACPAEAPAPSPS